MIRSRSERGKGERLRESIIDEAERLLLQHGNDELVNIRDVADAVDVTPPSIYRHFASKTQLILAVCERQFAAFNTAMDDAVATTSDPLGELRARGETYVRFGLAHPEAYVVMFMRPPVALATNKSETSESPEAFRSLVGAVQRAIDAGVFRNGDPSHAAAAIWASVHGLTSLLITRPNFDECFTDADTMLADVLHGAVAPFLA